MSPSLRLAAILGWRADAGWTDYAGTYYGGFDWPDWATMDKNDFTRVWVWCQLGKRHAGPIYSPRVAGEVRPYAVPRRISDELKEVEEVAEADFLKRAGR